MANLNTLATFNGTNGFGPFAGLIADANGDLFGTTQSGGTVFEIAKTTTGYAALATLVTLSNSNGSNVQARLLADANGDLFGTDGQVFEVAKTAIGYASAATVVASFTGPDGLQPVGGLIADAAGDLFGTTYAGSGATMYGTVYEIARSGNGYAGTPTTLVSFNRSNGEDPLDSLFADASGDLFGTTGFGASGGDGTVFEVAKIPGGYASTPTTLVNFNSTNGGFPGYGSLISDAAGDLFGTTEFGGASNDGTVFELAKTAGGYATAPTTLVAFSGANGDVPVSGLLADARGNLFGTTQEGGASNDGTVFEVAKTAVGYASTPTVLYSFSSTDGAIPSGTLIADANGDLFGTTLQGGASADGTAFELTNTGFISAAHNLGSVDDFNADGKSDLLLQNNNGSIVFYGLNGLAVNATSFINNPGPTWHVVGEADLNGDGKPDILLQNDNGSIVDYTMNGTTVTGAYSLSTPGSGWHVRGTGDFAGAGSAGFLLQNDNGAIVLFNTNGTTVTTGYSLGQLPAGWAIEGVGDFNGDGVPDVLVESGTGTLVDFTMNSTGTGFVSGGTIANVGPGWTVAGTADYNGDGKADILLHNDNGADVVFYMNGSTVTGTTAFGNPGSSYQTTVTGVDVNGDGTPDVLVQGTSSTLIGYTLGNNAAITAGAVLNTPGAGWNLVGGNPTTFIDGTGANLALTGTPGSDQFNLTTTAAGVHTIASFDPAQDAVALSVAAFPTYAAVQANEAAYQGGTFINLSPSSAIVIQGVTPAQLTAANFVLR